MRKLLKILPVIALALCLHIAPAHAQVVAPPVVPPVVVVPCTVNCGGPAFAPFFGAVAFAAFVVYADANGIDFPACGLWGLKCYDRYPGDE